MEELRISWGTGRGFMQDLTAGYARWLVSSGVR